MELPMSLHFIGVSTFIITIKAAEWFFNVNCLFVFLHSTWSQKFLFTLWAFMRQLTSMDASVMILQGMLVFKTAFTLGANEKLFSFVYSFMMLEGIFPCKFPLTLRAAKVFLTCVKFFMFLPIAWLTEFLFTHRATEWLVTFVQVLVLPQTPYRREFLVACAKWATEWFLLCMSSFMFFPAV